MRLHLLLAFSLPLISGCGPSQGEYNWALKHAAQLEEQVKSLKAELEELKFGSHRLLAEAKSAIEAKSDTLAKRFLEDLLRRHPSSPESAEAKTLIAQIDVRSAAAEQKRKQEEERKAKEERLAIERAAHNMKSTKDEMSGVTWYSHRNSPNLGKYLSAYFGSKNGSAANYPLRVKFQYHSDSWLFVRSVTVRADDKVYELGRLNFERDNGSGSIWEWVDMRAPSQEVMNHWMTAKRVVIRFEGDKYINDFTLPASQQAQLREVYWAWKSMGGKI